MGSKQLRYTKRNRSTDPWQRLKSTRHNYYQPIYRHLNSCRRRRRLDLQVIYLPHMCIRANRCAFKLAKRPRLLFRGISQ